MCRCDVQMGKAMTERGIQHYQTPKGEDRWRVVVAVEGKRKSLTFISYAKAVQFKRRCRKHGNAEAIRITDVELVGVHDETTLAEAFDRYLADLNRPNEGTKAEYRRAGYRSWASDDELGDLHLKAVTRERATRWVQQRGQQVSAKTLRNEFALLRSVLADCMTRDEISRDPTEGIKLKAGDAVDREFITREDFDRLCDHLEPRWLAFVHTIGATGLRWGEATALQWKHIDLAAGHIDVQQAWKRGGGGGGHRVIGAVKTKAGNRRISLFGDTVAHLALMKQQRDPAPDDFVFVGRDNKTPPTHSKFMAYVWNPARDAAGLDPKFTPHGLRHSHASWLLATGLPTWHVTRRLGHETTAITERVYGHFIPDVARLTDAALDQALGRRQLPAPSTS